MKQLDCPHCHKVNVLRNMVANCPYCNTPSSMFSGAEKLMDYCSSCGKHIKFVSCAYCKGIIVVDSLLPDEGALLCKLQTYFDRADIHFARAEQNATPETKEKIDELLGSLTHLFFGDKILKVTQTQADIIKIKADAYLAKAKTDDATYRVELIKKAAEMINDIPPELRPYVINTILGKDNTEPADKLANDSKLQTVVIEIEKEKLRKEQIDNNDRQRKANENL